MLTSNKESNGGCYLLRSVTENTNRKPSPDLIYCSLIALNSSWPAVSSTEKQTLVQICIFMQSPHANTRQHYSQSTGCEFGPTNCEVEYGPGQAALPHTHRHTHLLPCSIFQYRWKRDALKIERFGTVLAGRSRKKWKGGETMYHPRCHLLQIHIMNYMHFMWKKATFWKKFWGQGGGKVKVMHNNTVLDVTDCMAYISTQAQRANSDRWAHRPTGNTAPFRKAYSKHTWLLETGIQQTTLHNIL